MRALAWSQGFEAAIRRKETAPARGRAGAVIHRMAMGMASGRPYQLTPDTFVPLVGSFADVSAALNDIRLLP
jgi:hypothetical protein